MKSGIGNLLMRENNSRVARMLERCGTDGGGKDE